MIILILLFAFYVICTIQPRVIKQFYPVEEITEDANGIKYRKWVIRLQKKGKWIPIFGFWGYYGISQTKWDEQVSRFDTVSDAKMEMTNINYDDDPKSYWVNGTFDIDDENIQE